MSETVFDQQKAGRTTHVQQELSVLPENLEQLQQSLNELEKRLDGVTLQHDERAMNDTASIPVEVLVPVASQIRSANTHVNSMRYQVVSILDRLEL